MSGRTPLRFGIRRRYAYLQSADIPGAMSRWPRLGAGQRNPQLPRDSMTGWWLGCIMTPWGHYQSQDDHFQLQTSPTAVIRAGRGRC
ncbi:hypothetical protein CPAR01_03310 [Colletotrichum paranaense]|uniref:Uncharacterized protein n=1 Tax=Colletotrichum paranaense TaxID=1914294 RepID=A0ABQ9T1Z9_9PEZI|nr:uncharacterized protein CPAR01_03310 [Colletotrichum paranaense]KAK1545808.1 hypothetical protein CPAR01_03310 [Colletotrichum paranaense]